MLTAALELLPDRLANMAILPLQLRLVYEIGQRYGQQLDADQVKDLAGTFGLGAAAQLVEGMVRKVLGGVASGVLGGLLGRCHGLRGRSGGDLRRDLRAGARCGAVLRARTEALRG